MRELQLMHIRLFRLENKRLNIRLANAVKTFQQQKQEISELQGERDSLRQMVDNAVQKYRWALRDNLSEYNRWTTFFDARQLSKW